jgi:hypothetical protein
VIRLAALSFTALALIASACGGATTPTAAASATGAATSAATTAPTAAASANVDQSLIDLVKNRAASYKVTYDMTQTGQADKTTITQYFKAPFFRQDMTISAGGQTTTFITLVRPEGTYTCGTLLGPTPGCFSFGGAAGGAGGLGAPQAPQVVPQDLAGIGFVASGTRTVAGRDARCFTLTGGAQAPGAQVVSCYTAEGVPVYMSSKAGGTEVTMSATAFSTNVSEADFAVPYPVQKLPGQP